MYFLKYVELLVVIFLLSSSTLQADYDSPPSGDAQVYAYDYRNWDEANMGKYDQISAGWNPTGGEKRAYIKYDLSSIGSSEISKAILKLFLLSNTGAEGDTLDLGIYRVNEIWDEGNGTYHSGEVEKSAEPGELSWVQQPEIDDTPIAIFNPGVGQLQWIEIDITLLVKAWQNGTPNYGLVIKSIGDLVESSYNFTSRERDPELDEPYGESKAPTLSIYPGSDSSILAIPAILYLLI